MKQFITWTEIPVTDMQRAKAFYAAVFGVTFIDMNMAEFEYAIIQLAETMAPAALVKGYGYSPSHEGVTIYIDGTPDMDFLLEKVAYAGGSIIMDKTFFSKEAGYIGYIADTEGNKIGLQHN